MWISKKKFDALTIRINKLEKMICYEDDLTFFYHSLFVEIPRSVPSPQVKDRIRLIEETLGMEYERVPSKPEVPATWKAKKTKKRRAA